MSRLYPSCSDCRCALRSGQEVPRLRPQSGGRPALLTHGQLTRLVTALETAGLGADRPPAGRHQQLALDRMAQLFQVALAVDGLGHNKRELGVETGWAGTQQT